jgi:hypothetical protein
MKIIVVLLIVLSLILTIVYIIPKFKEKKTTTHTAQIKTNQLRTPEEEQAGFTLPEGFVIERNTQDLFGGSLL